MNNNKNNSTKNNKKYIDDDNNNNNNSNNNDKYKHDKHNQRSTNIMTSDIQTAATTTTTTATTLASGASGRGHAMAAVSFGATQAAQVVTQRHNTTATTTTTTNTDVLIVEDIDDDDDDAVAVTLAQANEARMLNALPHDNAIAAVAAADDDDDGSDSCASMETLSDNVSIWIDGEKHWISGVDANTTCAELICALLNYQQQQPPPPPPPQLQPIIPNGQETLVACGQAEIEQDQKRQQQQQYAGIIDGSTNTNTTTNKQHQQQHQQKQRERSNKVGNNAINQSTRSTKEDFKGNNNSTSTTIAPPHPPAHIASNDYVIVKQLRHCEEYLDGNAKVFDVLPARDTLARKECELLLRHLIAPRSQQKSHAAKVSSLLSTDKDSGMGSPVGSSRSARLRRRKHKSNFGSAAAVLASNWLAQANTLHPKSTSSAAQQSTANERLMKIILAQDETIHRQLSMLREKERQILKIEEEKHRVRERELGKNYLLETYLNALDEADANVNAFAGTSPTPAIASAADAANAHVVDTDATGIHDFELAPDLMNGVEIFIDEPYQRNQLTRPLAERKELTMHGNGGGNGNRAAGNDVAITDVRTTTITTTVDAGNKDANIDLQLYWLEKVYALNKQLQREEELLLKLTAKVRKHQVKRAYQTKTEVLQQIDKLDTDLATQVSDIRGVERKLLTANEQLKAKLGVLECLSQEFEIETDKERVTRMAPVSIAAVPEDAINATALEIKSNPLPKPPAPPLPPTKPTSSTSPPPILVATATPTTTTFVRHPTAHMAYAQLQNANDLLQLQKLIEKPAEHIDEALQLTKAPTEQLILAKNTRPVQLSDAKSVKKQMFTYGSTEQQQQPLPQPSMVSAVNKQQQQHAHAHTHTRTTTAAIVHTWQPTLPTLPAPTQVPTTSTSTSSPTMLITTPILPSLPPRHDITNLGTLV